MTNETVRIEFCPRCQTRISVCRSCDNGQQYCGSACSTLARRDSLRIIRRRYRASQKGRENHRKAEQRRRMRRSGDDSVGDQGSQKPHRADSLCVPTVKCKLALPIVQKTTSALRCCVCCLPARYVLNAVNGLWRPFYRRKSVPRTRRRGLGF